jgi:hypothetical protein
LYRKALEWKRSDQGACVAEGLSPTQKQEQLYRSELIRWGIELEKATKVARILALHLPVETLTRSEAALVKGVCQEWFDKRKQWEQAKQAMAQRSASSPEVMLESYQETHPPQESSEPGSSEG